MINKKNKEEVLKSLRQPSILEEALELESQRIQSEREAFREAIEQIVREVVNDELDKRGIK